MLINLLIKTKSNATYWLFWSKTKIIYETKLFVSSFLINYVIRWNQQVFHVGCFLQLNFLQLHFLQLHHTLILFDQRPFILHRFQAFCFLLTVCHISVYPYYWCLYHSMALSQYSIIWCSTIHFGIYWKAMIFIWEEREREKAKEFGFIFDVCICVWVYVCECACTWDAFGPMGII